MNGRLTPAARLNLARSENSFYTSPGACPRPPRDDTMPNPGPAPATPRTGRLGTAGLTPDEVRRRAAVRLAERVDLARSRHKPISLLRQEARRVLDLFLELEVPLWAKADRDKIADDVIAEALGLGPLDELFRDEAVGEFMVLEYNRV